MSSEVNSSEGQAPSSSASHERPEKILASIAHLTEKGVKPWDIDRYLREGPDPEGSGIMDGAQYDATERATHRFKATERQSVEDLTKEELYTREKTEAQLQIEQRVSEIARADGEVSRDDRVTAIVNILLEGLAPQTDSDDDRVGIDGRIDELMRQGFATELLDAIGRMPQDLPENNQGREHRSDLYDYVGSSAARINALQTAKDAISRVRQEGAELGEGEARDRSLVIVGDIHLRIFEKTLELGNRTMAQEELRSARASIEQIEDDKVRVTMQAREVDFLQVEGLEEELDRSLAQVVSGLGRIKDPDRDLIYAYDRMVAGYLCRGKIAEAREGLRIAKEIDSDSAQYTAREFASHLIGQGEYDEPIEIISQMDTVSDGYPNYSRKSIVENLAKHLGEAPESEKVTMAKEQLIALLESDSSADGKEQLIEVLTAINRFDRANDLIEEMSQEAGDDGRYRMERMKTDLQTAVIARGDATQIAEVLGDAGGENYSIRSAIEQRIERIEQGAGDEDAQAIMFALFAGYPMGSEYDTTKMLELLDGVERTLEHADKEKVIEHLLITIKDQADDDRRMGSRANSVMEFLRRHQDYRRDLLEESLDISIKSREYFFDREAEQYLTTMADIIGFDEQQREYLLSQAGSFQTAFENGNVSVQSLRDFIQEVSPELLDAVTGDDRFGYGRRQVVADLMAIFAEQDVGEVVRRFTNYKLNFALHALLTNEPMNIDVFTGHDAQLQQELNQAQDTIRKFIADEDELDIEQMRDIGQTQTGQKILARKDTYELVLALDSMMDPEMPVGRYMQRLMREDQRNPYLRRYLLSAEDPALAIAAVNDYLGGLGDKLETIDSNEIGSNVYTILTGENPRAIVQGLRAMDQLIQESNLGLFEQRGLKYQLLESLRKAIGQNNNLETVLESYRRLFSEEGLMAVGKTIDDVMGPERQDEKFMIGQDFLYHVLNAENQIDFVEHWLGLMQRTDQLGDLMRDLMPDRRRGMYSSFMYTLRNTEEMDAAIDSLGVALVRLQDDGYLDRNIREVLRNGETEALQLTILESMMHGEPIERVDRLNSVFGELGESKDVLLDDASPFYEFGKTFIVNALNGYTREGIGRQLAEFVNHPLYSQIVDRYRGIMARTSPDAYRYHVERMMGNSLRAEGGAEFVTSWFTLLTDQSSPIYRLVELDNGGMTLTNQLLDRLGSGSSREALVALNEAASYLMSSGLVDSVQWDSAEQLSATDQLVAATVLGANLSTLRANVESLRSKVPKIDEMVFSPTAKYREVLLTNILQKISHATDLDGLVDGYNAILDEAFLAQMDDQPIGLQRIMRTVGDAESPVGFAHAMSSLYVGRPEGPSSTPDVTLRNLFTSQDAPLALVLEPIIERLQMSTDPEGLLEVIQDAFTKGSEYWEQLFMLSSLEFAKDIGNESGGGRSLNILYPIGWVPGLHPSPDRNGGLLKLSDMDLDDRRAVSEMSVEQKRAIANLDELDDAVVAALTEIPMGRFKPDYQLAIYAAFLQDVVATSRDERARRFSDAVNRSLVAEQTAAEDRTAADILPPGTFLHGSSQSYVPRTLLNGNLCGEALGEAGSRTDMTPFQADYTVLLEDDVADGKTFREVVESSVSAGYGDLYYIFRRDVTSYEHGLLHNTNTPWGMNHALVPVGIPSTEINGMILRDASDPARVEELKTTILESGFYIPLYDMDGQLLFTSEEYDEARADLNLGVPVPVWDMNWRTGEQAGSNEGGFYAVPDGEGGTRDYYVKFDTQEEDKLNHIWSEVLADRLYQAFGLPVADTEVVQIEGRFAHASQIVTEAGPGDREKIAPGFVMDCWLGNWDVPYNPANYMTGPDGQVYRIDNGGALLFRARGARKDDALFGETVTEIGVGTDREQLGLGMRQEYPGLTDDMVHEQTERLAATFTDERIDELVDSVRLPRADRDLLKSRLKARRDDIIEKVLG